MPPSPSRKPSRASSLGRAHVRIPPFSTRFSFQLRVPPAPYSSSPCLIIGPTHSIAPALPGTFCPRLCRLPRGKGALRPKLALRSLRSPWHRVHNAEIGAARHEMPTTIYAGPCRLSLMLVFRFPTPSYWLLGLRKQLMGSHQKLFNGPPTTVPL